MKKLCAITLLSLSTLLAGCVTSSEGEKMQSNASSQQLQINSLNVRLQSVEYRLQKLERSTNQEFFNSNQFCYLNSGKYSPGTRLYGRTCVQNDGVSYWK